MAPSTQWEFPPAQNGYTIDVNNLGSSITDYLKGAAKQPAPSAGAFGSSAIFVDDQMILNVVGSSWVQEWCLDCSASYGGTAGWDACNNFSNASAALSEDLLLVDDTRTVPIRDRDHDYSASLCAYGIKNSNPYDITVAFPIIRLHRQGGGEYTYSQDTPTGGTGGNSPPNNPSQNSPSQSNPSATVYQNGQPTFISAASTTTSNQSNNSTNVGAIAGGVIGALAGLALLAVLGWYLMREKKKRAAERSAAAAAALKLETADPYFTPSKPEAAPFARDNLSRAEQGEAFRPAAAPPPPTYEHSIAGTEKSDASDRKYARYAEE